MIAGAGLGLMVGPANTDAINQVGRLSYGEATGITQTTRNFGASFGLAALGTLLVTVERRRRRPGRHGRGGRRADRRAQPPLVPAAGRSGRRREHRDTDTKLGCSRSAAPARPRPRVLLFQVSQAGLDLGRGCSCSRSARRA